MTAAKKLDVHTAELLTATVEIKTLTVSGRQVTLAVFRQLQNELLLDPETRELRGIPWGRVNYHPDKCADAKHHHVVWQLGDELRRAAVTQPARDPITVDVGDAGECYLDTRLALTDWRPADQRSYYSVNMDFGVPGTRADLPVSDEARTLLRYSQWSTDRLLENVTRMLGHAPTAADLDDLTEEICGELREAARLIARERDSYRTVCDLPQLFIAV